MYMGIWHSKQTLEHMYMDIGTASRHWGLPCIYTWALHGTASRHWGIVTLHIYIYGYMDIDIAANILPHPAHLHGYLGMKKC